MKDIVVIYHADCPDGFGGAWAAWKKFGNKAEYIPASYGAPVLKGLENKELYFIDFIYDQYDENGIKDLIKRNRRVTVIDHHVSKEKLTKLTRDYSYDINHSGSVLAWDYFHKDKMMPLLFKYIEGQDLWRFDLPDTVPLMTYIDSLDYDFLVWEKLIKDIEDDKKREEFTKKGKFMLNYKDKVLKKIIKENEKLVEFEGYEIYALNAPHEFASQICNILCTKKPPLALTWVEDKNNIHVSLRSNGSVDVSKIAEKYGGGGHKKSSGFSLSAIKSFPWKEIKMQNSNIKM